MNPSDIRILIRRGEHAAALNALVDLCEAQGRAIDALATQSESGRRASTPKAVKDPAKAKTKKSAEASPAAAVKPGTKADAKV